jgi:NAD(P)-dependent dehydrogenase (short-subunit alcohol dehydrogenase family)
MSNPKGIAILGATGGLGEAIVAKLGRRAPLTIGYARNEQKAARLAEAVAAAGGKSRTAQVDMTQSGSVKAFLDQAAAHWGGLQAIVSATGPAIPLCALNDVDDADFRRIYDTDVFGSFQVLKHGSAALAAGGGGPMVLFLTTAVLRTLENDGMSGGPKTAVSALIRQTAREMGPKNVRVNGVAPGVIDAGIVHSSFEVNAVAKGVIEDCMRKTPLGRMGRPEEIAALVDFLVSPEAAYISGQVIGIDGGYSA